MFSQILKNLRSGKGLSQRELSSQLGLSANCICEYEKGRSEPNLDTLMKLSSIFECSIDYLVGNSDDFGVVQILNNDSSPLTSLEKELLNYFSKMSESQKHRLIGYAFAMVN